jgi:hypothetical protein
VKHHSHFFGVLLDKTSPRAKEHGLCMVLVQTTRTPGDIVLTAESDGLKSCTIKLNSHSK